MSPDTSIFQPNCLGYLKDIILDDFSYKVLENLYIPLKMINGTTVTSFGQDVLVKNTPTANVPTLYLKDGGLEW